MAAYGLCVGETEWYKRLFGYRRKTRQEPFEARDRPEAIQPVIPDLTSLAVVGFLLTCVFLLNTLIFQPVLRVMDQRGQAVTDARELAESASVKATAAADEYARTLANARAEVYKQMDDTRRAALDRRASALARARAEVERELSTARATVAAQSSEARATLDDEAGELAGVIVGRVLGRVS